LLTAANLIKMFLGIAFISTPKSVQQAGLYGSILGFVYVVGISLFCVYLLLKARNRFKQEEIVDVCDLGVRLYGPGVRPWLSTLLVLTNSTFLICYIMYFGSQTDQLVCKTFKQRECGHGHEYSAIIVAILLPILFLRRMASIGYFSIFVLCFTFLAVGLIIYLSSVILSMSPQEVEDTYHIQLKDEDRDYNYWSTSQLPIFCAAMATLFEGNQ
jgi:amino acid permease